MKSQCLHSCRTITVHRSLPLILIKYNTMGLCFSDAKFGSPDCRWPEIISEVESHNLRRVRLISQPPGNSAWGKAELRKQHWFSLSFITHIIKYFTHFTLLSYILCVLLSCTYSPHLLDIVSSSLFNAVNSCTSWAATISSWCLEIKRQFVFLTAWLASVECWASFFTDCMD